MMKDSEAHSPSLGAPAGVPPGYGPPTAVTGPKLAMRPAPADGRRSHAAGYSRFVSLTKFILPALALLLIVLVVIWPHLQVKDTRFRLGFTAITAGESEDPSMVNPRFLSADKDSQSYSVTADLAKNLLKENATVQLEMPKADISLDDGTWLVLTAETGVLVREKKALELTGAVNVFHDSGYEFRTESASIDLAKGIASGKNSIRGQGPFGEIEGEGFKLDKERKSILFTGKSRVVIYPGIGKQTQ